MTDDVLSCHIAENALVSIKRASIASGSLQAFVIGYSATLIAIHYVRDFQFDGYLVLRRSDISEIGCRATDRFQRDLIDDAGATPHQDPMDPVVLDSFPELLASCPETEVVIVECESADGDVFTIGRYAGIDVDGFLSIHEFSGPPIGTTI
ncbi:MAG: hypothetical protein AAGA30_11050 [Planctomycetota bacterium]